MGAGGMEIVNVYYRTGTMQEDSQTRNAWRWKSETENRLNYSIVSNLEWRPILKFHLDIHRQMYLWVVRPNVQHKKPIFHSTKWNVTEPKLNELQTNQLTLYITELQTEIETNLYIIVRNNETILWYSRAGGQTESTSRHTTWMKIVYHCQLHIMNETPLHILSYEM